MDADRTMTKRLFYSRNAGNTIAEYALIASLVCLASIAAVFSFSGAFSEKLSGVKADMQARVDATSAQATQIAVAKAIRNAAASSRGGIELSGSENGGAQAVTTGANGDILASRRNSSNALEDSIANLSESDKNLVRDVSNTAHEIARMQEALEQLSQYSDGDLSKFQHTKMMVGGQMLSAYELAKALGNDGLAAKLEEKKNTVLFSGIQGDLKDKVAAISNDVKSDATKTSDKTNEVLSSNTDPAQVKEVTDSGKTDTKAANICEASGGVDSGTQCGS